MVAVLILLVVSTLLSVAMMRRIGSEERIAGSVREHQRAFEAAQYALQYAEGWVDRNYTGNVATCSDGTLDAATLSNVKACEKALTATSSIRLIEPSTWATRFSIAPTGATISASGGNGTLYAAPGFYIHTLGKTPDGRSVLLQMNTYGYGGNSGTVTVLQSVYAVTPRVTNLDTP